MTQKPEEGNAGWLVWQHEYLPAIIDWSDPVLTHGLSQRIKYVRLVRRRASSPHAQGADCEGYRYYTQLIVEGVPYLKPKHTVGASTLGLDLGPSTIAIVPQEGEARLLSFCAELKADQQVKRRLQRKVRAPAQSQQPAQLRPTGTSAPCKARLETQPGVQGDSAKAGLPRTQAGCSSQEFARPAGARGGGMWHDHHH